MSSTDPAGLLNRVPDLKEVAHDPKIAAAVASGNPHAVYSALWWGNLFGRFKDKQEAVQRMLHNRRLWVEEIASAPGMFTLNGFGVKIYGESEQDNYFKTYVTTHFITALFIPIFPIGAYVASTEAHNSYRFYGKVPLTGTMRVWQGVALSLPVVGLAASMMASCAGAMYQSRYDDLTVINGLPFAVTAEIGSVKIPLEPGTMATRELPTGDYTLRVTNAAGVEVESESVHIGGSTDHLWNIGGAADVYWEEVVYGGSATPAYTSYCGQKDIEASYVEYRFTEPPEQVYTSNKYGSERRAHLGFEADPTGTVCLKRALAEPACAEGSCDSALTLADALVRTSVLDLARATQEIEARATPEFALQWLNRHRSELDVSSHRVRQELMDKTGQQDAKRQEYAALAQQQPEDADAAYLAARALPDEEQQAAYEGVAKKFPDHYWNHRALAWLYHQKERYDEACTSWERAAALDPENAKWDVAARLESLVAAKKWEKARTLAKEGESASFEEALERALVLRRAGDENAIALAAGTWKAGGSAAEQRLIEMLSPPSETPSFTQLVLYNPSAIPSLMDNPAMIIDLNAISLILLEGELLAQGRTDDLAMLHILHPSADHIGNLIKNPSEWRSLPAEWAAMTRLARAIQPDTAPEERAQLLGWIKEHDLLEGPATAAMKARSL